MSNAITIKEYTYNEYKTIAEKMEDKYKFLSLHTIAKSCAGRDIFALKIGSVSDPVLYCGAFHGSERITATVLLMFASELCEAIKYGLPFCGIDTKRALYKKSIIIVPLVNPDGCEISLLGRAGCSGQADRIEKLSNGDFSHWQANFHGVDINHNFPAGWDELKKREIAEGITAPCATRFGGYSPVSEPETAALVSLCKSIPFRHAIALHTQGEVIYHSYKNYIVKNSLKIAKIFSASSGYALETASGLAEGGGFKDWFIENFSRPAFTFELGKGENPLPASCATDIYKRVKEALMLGAVI